MNRSHRNTASADAPKLPAGAYGRMSTDKQEDSPERQRADLISLAEREGCEIKHWYFDHGMTGTESSKRGDFQQMLKDAQAGKFKVLLLSELSRLSREDPLACFPHFLKLRDAGVQIISDKEGRLRWDDIGSLITTVVSQHGNHNESKNISFRSVSGRRQKLRNGKAVAAVAFGYDKELIDAAGNVVKRVNFREKFSVPKDWTCRLVLSDDVVAVEALRWAFRAFRDGTTLADITREFNRRGIRTMKGEGGTKGKDGSMFRRGTLKSMMQNPIYIGTLQAGRRSSAKFNRLSDDGSTFVIEHAHEALVDEATFYDVAAKLKMQSRHIARAETASRVYLLSTKIHAQPCGCKMYGHYNSNRKAQDYACIGSRPFAESQKGEGHIAIRCEALDRFVINTLTAQLESPEMRGEIRKAVALFMADGVETDLGIERSRLSRLEESITRAEDSLFTVLADGSPQTVKAMTTRLDKMRRDRDDLADSLDTKQNTTRLTPEATVVLHRLTEVLANLRNAEPLHLAQALDTVIQQVTIRRETVIGTVPRLVEKRGNTATRESFRLAQVSGRIEFKPGLFPIDAIEFTDADLYPERQLHRVTRFVQGAVGMVTTAEVCAALQIPPISAHRQLKCGQMLGLIERIGGSHGGGWRAAGLAFNQLIAAARNGISTRRTAAG